jgi:hypothetical protein
VTQKQRKVRTDLPSELANLESHLKDRAEIHNFQARSNRKGFYRASAALEAYFSYLEHLLAALLAFSNYDPSQDKLDEFVNLFWAEKFKRIFDLTKDRRAEQTFRSLLNIKERFRNPLSHGGFAKDGETFFFHVPGLGAVPASLSLYWKSLDYDFNPIIAESFRELCDVLDKADEFFKTGSKRLAVRCIRAGIDIAFDQASIQEYNEIQQSPDQMKYFIEYTLRKQDDTINMDW